MIRKTISVIVRKINHSCTSRWRHAHGVPLRTRNGAHIIKKMRSLKATLKNAGEFASHNDANVGVRDGRGYRISGDELPAC